MNLPMFRALKLGLSGAFGQLASLGVIAAFAAGNLADVGLVFAVAASFEQSQAAFAAAIVGLGVLALIAALVRFACAGRVLGGTWSVVPRSWLAMLGSALVLLLASSWRTLALTSTGWAYVTSLFSGHWGGLTSLALALAVLLSFAVAIFAQLWVEAGFAVSIVRDEPFFVALRRVAASIAARPFAYLGILVVTGLLAFVLEVALGGLTQLFSSGDLPASQMWTLSFASRATAAVLNAWPLALAWLTRVCAFAALERAALGQLPPAQPPKATLIAETV